MPAFADIEQITIRVGPKAYKFGDVWERSCQGKVEHDRYIYLYAIAGDFTQTELKEIIRETKKLAKQFGWKGIRWTRKRLDGTEHPVNFTVTQKEDTDN